MSYDHATIALEVKARLLARPETTLNTLSQEFQVDRHTIARSLRARFGATFRELKKQIRTNSLRDALDHREFKSMKQIAAESGYASSASLARLRRRRRD